MIYKIIRWLSDMSGVTKQIEKEVNHSSGSRLMESANWYNAKHRSKSANTLWFYGFYLRNNVVAFPDDFLRTKLDSQEQSILCNDEEIKSFMKLTYLK